MDKNKNRTDLLAAGRKKLQQFRKKKEKGSGSHVKPSHRASMAADGDVAASDAVDPEVLSDPHTAEVDPAVLAVDDAGLAKASDGDAVSTGEGDGGWTPGGTDVDNIGIDGGDVITIEAVDGERVLEINQDGERLDVENRDGVGISRADEVNLVSGYGETDGHDGSMESSSEATTASQDSVTERGDNMENHDGGGISRTEEKVEIVSVYGETDGQGSIETSGVEEAPTTSQDPVTEDGDGVLMEPINVEFIGLEKLPEQGTQGFSLGLHEPRELLLDDKVVRFLLGSGNSGSLLCLRDLQERIVSESGLLDILEGVKRDLYLMAVTNDFLQLDLAEQTKASTKSERHLSTLVEEAEEKSRGFKEELVQCQSEKEELRTHCDYLRGEVEVLDGRAVKLQDQLLCLQEELVQCQSEKEELRTHCDSLRGEVEVLDGRAVKLQDQLLCLQEESAMLSVELADCKDSLNAVRVENESMSRELISSMGEKEKLEVDMENAVNENRKIMIELGAMAAEKEELNGRALELQERLEQSLEESARLFGELVDCKASFGVLETKNASLDTQLVLAREEREKLEEVMNQIVNERATLSTELLEHGEHLAELSDFKRLFENMQTETVNLNEHLVMAVDEKKKVEQEKEHFAAENRKLAAELLEHKEQLLILQNEQVQLEADLKEAITNFELVAEENIYLSSSLDVHKAKLDELKVICLELSAQAVGADNQLNSSNDESFLAVESSKEQNESYQEEQSQQPGLGALTRRLEEAEKTVQKLDKAIQGMHSHSVSLSTTGSKTASGVSKLIQAFESKRHKDDAVVEETSLTGEEKPADSFLSANELLHTLGNFLKQLGLDAWCVNELFQEEQEGKRLAVRALKELEVDFEVQKQHNYDLEVGRQEWVRKLTEWESRIDGMFQQLNEMQQDCDDEAGRLINEIEQMQKVAVDQESMLEEERNSINAAISAAIKVSTGLMDLPSLTFFHSLDVGARITTLVNSATKSIQDLQEKLEASNMGHEAARNACENLNSELLSMGRRNILATELLCKIHGGLGQLVNGDEYLMDNKLNEKSEEHLRLMSNNLDVFMERLQYIHDEWHNLHTVKDELEKELMSQNQMIQDLNRRCADLSKQLDDDHILHTVKDELEKELMSQNQMIQELNRRCADLSKQLDDDHSSKEEMQSQLMSTTEHVEEMNKRCFNMVKKLTEEAKGVLKSDDLEFDSIEPPIVHLESSVAFLISKYREAIEQVILSKDCLREFIGHPDISDDDGEAPLHILLRQEFVPKMIELGELQAKTNCLNPPNPEPEEMLNLKETLIKMEESLVMARAELDAKVAELEQSEQRVNSLREKLSLAVAKGKGLVVQRDNLKHSLVERTGELEKSLLELQSKDRILHEVEEKLKNSESGERVEALESELSYIRHSASALRESFLLKDSVLQRIEETLEELELSEQFHSQDLIEKIEWLVRSVSGNSYSVTERDQKSYVAESHSDAGFLATNVWNDDVQLSSNPDFDDLKRKHDDLQSRFYVLAEQNDMLEQSLVERNNLVQRWEEVLDMINMPLHLRSMEPEERIEWLGRALADSDRSRQYLVEQNDLLEQSLAERSALLQRWEEVLDRLNVPSQIQSLGPEYRIEWLEKTLIEVRDERENLQLKIEKLEISSDLLKSDLDESQRKIIDLDATLVSVTHDKDLLFENLEKLRLEHENCLEKETQDKLDRENMQNEIAQLRQQLVEKLESKDHNDVEDDLRKLLDLVHDALPDHEKSDAIFGGRTIQCLEESLRKLIDIYTALYLESPACTIMEKESTGVDGDVALEEGKTEQHLVALREELDEAVSNMICANEERDATLVKLQSLVSEAKMMGNQIDALQEQLSQEEQKSASARDKLNLAVRKGKGLVQQRDSLKQTIEEMNGEIECLKKVVTQREEAIMHYEQRMKDLLAFKEKVETLETENTHLKTRLGEAEYSLEDTGRTLTKLLTALHAIDVTGESSLSDPVRKVELLGKLNHDLHAALVSSEQNAKNSKRAAELLVAELNEVQDRVDHLQEELLQAEAALTERSKQKDDAEAERADALSQLKRLMSARLDEEKKQLANVLNIKAVVDQLKSESSTFCELLTNVFAKDLDLFYHIDTGIQLILKQMKGADMDPPIVSLPSSGHLLVKPAYELKFSSPDAPSELNIPMHIDENVLSEHLGLVARGLHDCIKEFDDSREKFQGHFCALEQHHTRLSKNMESIQREIGFWKDLSESSRAEISHLESVRRENESEIDFLRKNVAVLYGACNNSILELENRKAPVVGNGPSAVGKTGRTLNFPTLSNGLEPADRTTFSLMEESIRNMADMLLSTVKGSINIQHEVHEGNQKELKETISQLQKELQEKDIQTNRICTELVTQIREAEAVAKKYSMDLDSAKKQVHSLEKQVEVMELDRQSLQLRMNDELKDLEASSKESQERIRLLTDALATKEHENEGLLQALDEEELQMESLKRRVEKLDRLLQQKNVEVETIEASRRKLGSNLSTTLAKFDELHNLSESLLTEVEDLQSQLKDRDSDISFLRQEVTKCTNDVLAAQENNKKNSDELHEFLMWAKGATSLIGGLDVPVDDKEFGQLHEYTELLDKQIASVMAELDDARLTVQSRDALLQMERGRVEELLQKSGAFEASLHEKESQRDLKAAQQPANSNSEIESLINKRAVNLGPVTPHVRSGRKANSEQVALSIDLEQGTSVLDDEDDDKAHGFKPLSMSRIFPRATRRIADGIDGIWVSSDRFLMRQPIMRLGLLLYWFALHAFIAAYIV